MPSTETDFNAIRISPASPEQIKMWSYGEVTKPETINYRTLRPEKDGLFCERIFGPTKDWECYCGKYKKVRFRGVTCDRCGVEVTRAKVRRERMGHINLAAPVAHIWFSGGTPSRIALLLDLSPRNLERVNYFAQYIITAVDDEARGRLLDNYNEFLEKEIARIEEPYKERINQLTREVEEAESSGSLSGEALEERRQAIEEEISKITVDMTKERQTVQDDVQGHIDEMENLRPNQLLPESRYRELKENCGEAFKAGMGAEAVLEVLKKIDIEVECKNLHLEAQSTSGQRRKKALKRLRVMEALRKSGNKPDWMVLTALPVLPPDLRPMVQLDGGRFATSDLNDLYRRVINRNNRLKRLLELQAPEIIIRNEKRMLQEAVDALIDNGRRGKAISGNHNHKLKSLSDLLRGKQGRFRQNLLGKRVDYSGRSVIVVGPDLELHQCGLPKRMALELFKPFVMNRLVLNGHAQNIRSAKRMVEQGRPEVWDILEEVISTRPVMLNRAPTLHRLGIQAFEPVLVEGSAIQIHPLVCTAFNADFDGDQMAVHVPLSRKAVMEAKNVILSPNNMLSPSSGEPVVAPTLDMVLGCYYMTSIKPKAQGEGGRFSSREDARLAYDLEQVDLRAEILVRDLSQEGGWLKTTPGRILFNEILPLDLAFYNEVMDKKLLKDLVSECHRVLGNEETAKVLDAIKKLGFHFATIAGVTIAINDIEVPPEKAGIIREADEKINLLGEQFQLGLISEDQRYRYAVETWTKASDDLTVVIEERLPTYGGIYMMATSGAKGNIAQIKQMAGMRGLMSDPKGRIIELPIRSSFRQGLSVLEYFISTHGARKGLADTALRTADSGYLTRRLIDVSQDVIVLTQDCGTSRGIWIQDQQEKSLTSSFAERILGRMAASPIEDPKTGDIIVDRNQEMDEDAIVKIVAAGVTMVYARSPLICEAWRGLCQYCYGRSPSTGRLVILGEAIGIIAAQSIGEPGTQLTMRTFHTGGVAGLDITSGLPRVEELFEARVPKGQSILSDIDGIVQLVDTGEGRRIQVVSHEEFRDEYPLPPGYKMAVEEGDYVDAGVTLAVAGRAARKGSKAKEESLAELPGEVVARISGEVQKVSKNALAISSVEEDEREYLVPAASYFAVQDGEAVTAGQPLTAGTKNPQDLLRIQGREAVQNYLVEEVQKVYRSQGVSIHDKHIEIIIRQMLRKVRIDAPGDTGLLPGELVDRAAYEAANSKALSEGGEPAMAHPVLLGVTKASLNTESFLAAASFQETTRVLTEASVQGSVDHLRGLKENVIIGRLIPARLDLSAEGRARLGLDEEEEEFGQLRADEIISEPMGIPAVVSDELMPTDGFEAVVEEVIGEVVVEEPLVEVKPE